MVPIEFVNCDSDKVRIGRKKNLVNFHMRAGAFKNGK